MTNSPLSLLGATLLTLLNGGYAAAADRPNVLFIPIDDLVPTLGAYGDLIAQTPRIDSLANQGVTFLNHHCQWAVCGPSRAALTTSLMPEETNVMGFKPIRAVLPDVITMPQHFRNNGYETACTGKFHDPRTVGIITDPNGQTSGGSSTDDVPSWSIPYVNAGSGFSPSGKPAVDNSNLPDSDYADHRILTEGLSLIDTLAAGNKPFFLGVGFKKPHLPFVAPENYWNLYTREEMPLATFTSLPVNASANNSDSLSDNGELLRYQPYDTTGLPDAAAQRELMHGYYACVSFVDSLVGQLLDKLAVTDDPVQAGKKMSETTIVVIWGDHGFHLGDHGKWAKHTVMERGTSCPLIIYDPRSTLSGAKTTSPANSMDIYPTLCELAALPIPEQPLSSSQTTGRPLKGRSLVPVLQDSSASVHHGAISQFSKSGGYGYSYRTERFRYIEWVNSSNVVTARDLYDYQVAPLEPRNLVDDPEYAGIAFQLSRSMRAETTTQGATRLQNSTPITTGGDAYLPATIIAASVPEATLSWPGSGGVCYDIEATSTLAPGSWVDDFVNLPGPAATFPLIGTARFFRIGFGSNTPPRFLSDPILQPVAYSGTPYAANLAASTSDPGDSLSFSKIDGPSWLTVAGNGDLTGTPGIPDALCANYFNVLVTDSSGCTARATIQVTVFDPASNTAPSFTSDPVVKADATVDSPYSGSLASDAADPDIGQTLTFSKTSGPTWLDIAANGDLSGTPLAGDIGLTPCTIRVTDPLGAFTEAQLEITVALGSGGSIQVITKTNTSTSGVNFGTVYFSGVSVQAGDLLVVSHANNKNTSSNTITLSGLGANSISNINSGSSGTGSAAWIFHSTITVPGSFDLTIDTSHATKTVSQATTLFVLRPTAGSLAVAATASNVAPISPGVTSLDLAFTFSPAVTDAYGIAAGSIKTDSYSSNPVGWTQELNGNNKRRTLSNPDIDGAIHTATTTSSAATDMALAGIIVKISP